MRGPESIQRLVKELSRLPGIGSRTAQRLAYYILEGPKNLAENLSRALLEVREKIRSCSVCYTLTETDPCHICSDPGRDRSIVCVVESPQDLEAIERTGKYKGLYHVLQGRLSPVNGITPDDLKIEELATRARTGAVQEIIIATNPNVEGSATAFYIADLIRPTGVKITRIAHGIPVGGEIEYSDAITLEMAMGGRSEM